MAITSAIAAVAMVALTVVSSEKQAQAQEKAADYNAALAQRQADQVAQAAQLQEQRQRDKTASLLSAQRAAVGASGIDLEGSALTVMEDTASGAELDALLVRHSGSMQELSLRSQSAMDRLSGYAARQGAYGNMGASLLQGGTALSRIYGPSSTPAPTSGDYPRSAAGNLEFDP